MLTGFFPAEKRQDAPALSSDSLQIYLVDRREGRAKSSPGHQKDVIDRHWRDQEVTLCEVRGYAVGSF
jgi:hypothetical protein